MSSNSIGAANYAQPYLNPPLLINSSQHNLKPEKRINRAQLYLDVFKSKVANGDAIQRTFEAQDPPLLEYFHPNEAGKFIINNNLSSINLNHSGSLDSASHILSRDALLKIYPLTDDNLKNICTELELHNRSSQITRISLSGQNSISSYGLTWLKQFSNLTYLDIRNCDNVFNEYAEPMHEDKEPIHDLESWHKLFTAKAFIEHELSPNFEQNMNGLYFLKTLPLNTLKLSSKKLQDATLAHFKDLPLTSLDIHSRKITGAGLAYLPTSLTHLNLSSCYNLTNPGLKHLNCTHLKSLNLSLCESLTDEGLEALEKFEHLSSLDLSDCKFSGVGFTSLQKLSQLTNLNLSYCQKLKDIAFSHIGNLHLVELGLSESDKLTDEALKYLKHPLADLFVSGCERFKIGFANLKPENLTSLTLNGVSNITNHALSLLKNAQQLKYLEVSYCRKISNGGLDHIKNLSNLTHLDLECCSINSKGLANLRELVNLTFLNLSTGDEDVSKITDAGLVNLSGLTNITDLNLSHCSKISDAGLVHIEMLSRLSSLNLAGCKNITSWGLYGIKELPLTFLSLRECSGITELGAITNFTNLTFLGLAKGNFQESELIHLAKVPLSGLNLDQYYRLTNDGLAHLRNLPYLTSLDIGFCTNITNKGAEHLENLPLERLGRINPCGITDKGKKRLITRPDSFPLKKKRRTLLVQRAFEGQ